MSSDMAPNKSSSGLLWAAVGCGVLVVVAGGMLVLISGAGAMFWLSSAPSPPTEVIAVEATPSQQDPGASGAPSGTPSSTPGEAMQGEWGFGEECGQTAGGSPIVVGHTLTITGNKARATANGYQTWLEVDGTLYPVGTDQWDLHVDKSDGTSPKPAGTVVMRITGGKKRLQVESREWPFACAEGTVKFQREK